jgi:hypothetical protein
MYLLYRERQIAVEVKVSEKRKNDLSGNGPVFKENSENAAENSHRDSLFLKHRLHNVQ